MRRKMKFKDVEDKLYHSMLFISIVSLYFVFLMFFIKFYFWFFNEFNTKMDLFDIIMILSTIFPSAFMSILMHKWFIEIELKKER